MIILESAAAVWDCRAIAGEAECLRYIVGAPAVGGDLQRCGGYHWTPGAAKRLVINSSVVFGMRLADTVEPLYCPWMNVRDLDDLETEAIRGGQGHTGWPVIHPSSQLPVANAVLTPSQEALDGATALVETVDQEAAQRIKLIAHNGQMVGVAMARAARQPLGGLRPGGGSR